MHAEFLRFGPTLASSRLLIRCAAPILNEYSGSIYASLWIRAVWVDALHRDRRDAAAVHHGAMHSIRYGQAGGRRSAREPSGDFSLKAVPLDSRVRMRTFSFVCRLLLTYTGIYQSPAEQRELCSIRLWLILSQQRISIHKVRSGGSVNAPFAAKPPVDWHNSRANSRRQFRLVSSNTSIQRMSTCQKLPRHLTLI